MATSTQNAPIESRTNSDLGHTWFIDIPGRTLCGRPRDTSDPGQPYEERSATADDCLVCESLAQGYVDGRWAP